ncbi:universal stress protein [Streptomyces sp. 4N509B]|uniref:universal stress protein n=1 Tax=Streptomyces sp. 4N509B TaxID=3457413 RepID=UPI003FD57A66
MERPVVVGIDGSAPGNQALDWAADHAARHDRALRVVLALFQERYDIVTREMTLGLPENEDRARALLADAARRVAARRPEVGVTVEVLPQDPVPALLHEGREAFTLVVGNRGHGTLVGMLLGSVSLGVAGRATCPTVVVRGDARRREGRLGRIVLGVEGTEREAEAVRFAFREAEARGGELAAVHAWLAVPDLQIETETLLDEVLAPLTNAHPDVRLSRAVVEAPTRDTLLAEAENADLLVLGAHRRTRPVGLRLGLVSHALLHHAACPVAVVPEP